MGTKLIIGRVAIWCQLINHAKFVISRVFYKK